MSVRMLLPVERKALAGHLTRLDRRGRAMRFEAEIGDAAVARYVEGIDMRRDAVFGFFDGHCILRGAAHVAIADDHAELGLSVESGYRGLGHGGRLLERAVDWSRLRARRLSSQCLTTNGWMMGRMRRLGCGIERDRETAVARLDLAPADMSLACRAVLAEQAGWIGFGTTAMMAGFASGLAQTHP